ncbi:MAG: phospho-N-acetylmuramoyl-pentapeptide-transferase [Candidatus Omnitrophica bacterium]|nr:phospho-N-acetylmuramoyl-pentapeptide-transferase [Candidatus Omnitrophota bacterium]MBU4478004.1 phospho-N-acetylmuramoyl-pentapeptide-transferase [Candidatus Omnitrophota bacterium]MCG2703937.1 phospho-N-acetylmuramoyl-pentapeptide-transferase [Candidatus Omnitrophota bacterium]
MFYYFFYPLRELFFGFNVFKYITFRATGCSVTAFVLSALLGNIVIRKLRLLKIGENVRKGKDYVSLHAHHKHKEGTPTMGGILILLVVFLSVLLWADLSNRYIWIAMLATFWLGIIGFADDYIKLTKKNSRGLTAAVKLIGQLIIGLVIGWMLYNDPNISDRLDIPFAKNLVVHLGVAYVFFVTLVIIGASNAVNLTDGLDGLAIGCTAIAALTYSGFSYLTGHAVFSEYLQLIYVPHSGELAVFCAALFGAGLGFLWYNCHPADVFMGDTGALALGGALGTVAVLIKKELLLLLVGGVFVAEALSVIIQVFSFRYRKKRVFLMAPLHHHFQLKGWAESKVIFRFLIVAIILALLSFSTLKLR